MALPTTRLWNAFNGWEIFSRLFYYIDLVFYHRFPNVKKVQAGYKVQTLSAFLDKPPPEAAPAINFIEPLTPAEQRTSPEFFNVLNFVLQFLPHGSLGNCTR